MERERERERVAAKLEYKEERERIGIFLFLFFLCLGFEDDGGRTRGRVEGMDGEDWVLWGRREILDLDGVEGYGCARDLLYI